MGGIKRVGHYNNYLVNFYRNVVGKVSSTQAPYVPPSTINYTYTIPNVVGITYNQAIVALNSYSITYSVVYTNTSNSTYQQYAAQGGYVYAQTPPAGNQPTNVVVVSVYQYVNTNVLVPNVIGLSLTTAQSTLSNIGLNYSVSGTTTSNIALDQIVQTQSIAAGTSVSAATTVALGYTYYSISPTPPPSPTPTPGPTPPPASTPAQQDAIVGSTTIYATPGSVVSLPISGPQSLTNISVNGVNQSIFGSLNASFIAPSTAGNYSIQPYDGEIPLLSSFSLVVYTPSTPPPATPPATPPTPPPATPPTPPPATPPTPPPATPPTPPPATPPAVTPPPTGGSTPPGINPPPPTPPPATPPTPPPATPPAVTPPPTGGGCWVVGSLVTLSNGLRVPIETLKVGDSVMTADIPTYPNGEDSSKWFPVSVWSTDNVSNISLRSTKVTYARTVAEPYYYLINEQYGLTWEHWMFVERDLVWQFQQMANVKVGDKLLDINNRVIDITKIEIIQDEINVVLLDVEPNDLFYAENILTHNYRPPVKT